MAVYREFEYIVWALATMGPGPWATWNWDRGPRNGTWQGPGPSLGPCLGPGAWDLVGPQAGPGLSKKHDSTMKMKHFDAKGIEVQYMLIKNIDVPSTFCIFCETVTFSFCFWTLIDKT